MITRIFVKKKPGFDTESTSLARMFRDILGISALEKLTVAYRYDLEALPDEVMKKTVNTIFSEPNVDDVLLDEYPLEKGETAFAYEYLPGQYDQHADSAAQCIQILTGTRPVIKVSKLIVLTGALTDADVTKIKDYLINPVDSQVADLGERASLVDSLAVPKDVERIEGFVNYSAEKLEAFRAQMGFAMSPADIAFVQTYFRDEEGRDPSVTELRVIDTYWSDHCRHTTFLTELGKIEFEVGPVNEAVEASFRAYDETRDALYGEDTERPYTLMDLAVIGTKELKKRGILADLDESEEINACSIKITVDHDGVPEPWLLMFKNETHNHPTEIEPFGGAATCLGGAIRDPLSGRSYVYQAMRLTGAWDPRTPIDETLPGKLPQRKISVEAAQGYSSYGNQIGLATGQVVEVYHPGFLAKRMEVGAVIAAAPEENVIRERPVPGDVVLLVGGRTGRDGIGGATGSSKSHTEESITESGAEVQKGNPVEERKIQRLFRNPAAAKLIKRCNDFGAGGVSVAIGELAESLVIDLDAVPKKYEGLDGTELAISESQERMAVVVEPADVEAFMACGEAENLEVTKVAEVTDTGRLVMSWRGDTILDLSRAFLDTNGAAQYADVMVAEPAAKSESLPVEDVKTRLHESLTDLNTMSQKGLGEMFDGTIGAGTVVMPYGGKYALTPQNGMAAKIPMQDGDTTTVSLMTYGYAPELAAWSPYHGGEWAVVESLSKLVALGGEYAKARLSFQEYFERLGTDPAKWGKPFAALLGAYEAQRQMGTPAIGGKDSMSGTFEDLTVPPTLISFAVAAEHIDHVITAELKEAGSDLYLVTVPADERGLVDFDTLKEKYTRLTEAIHAGKIRSAKVVTAAGVLPTLVQMAAGNRIGVELSNVLDNNDLFDTHYAGIIVETAEHLEDEIFLGVTTEEKTIVADDASLDLAELIEIWEAPIRSVYPEKVEVDGGAPTLSYHNNNRISSTLKFGAPKVFIPVFPGTNCEVDSARAFAQAGAEVETVLFRNQSELAVAESLEAMAKAIRSSQMIMIPGGFSAGDQPDGSGKFIATVFRNAQIADEVMNLLDNREGLILGICNGFQALIKLGLVPYGKIVDIEADMPTLTYNAIGRHVSTIPATRVASDLSPWLYEAEVGGVYQIPMSHGEGRFMADEATLKLLAENGQIATQYVDFDKTASMDGAFNPNGSVYAVEGITSADGRVFGKMGHSERIGAGLYKNIPGEKDQRIFAAGVKYFK